MNKKRVMALLLSGAMAVGMLAGCGSSESSSETGKSETAKSETSSGKKEKLTFWFPTFAASEGEVTDQEFWDETLDSFEEENNCEVKVEIIPWDNYEEKYLTGINSNDGPDVGYLYMEMFYDYIEMGALADVGEYFTDEEKENYLYYDLGNIQGGQYALPVVVGNPRLLACNMDVLKEAGIEQAPTNWDELQAACEAIKASVPDVAPLMESWGSTHYGALNEIYWPVFWGAGGEIVDEEGNLTIDSEAGLKATEYIYSLKQNGLLPETCTSTDDAMEQFKNGEAAMTFSASSSLARVEGFEWDFSILEGPTVTKTFVASDCLVMFNKCENKDLASKLMKYATSKEVMADFHERVTEQPPITADDSYSGDERFEDLFINQTDKFQSLPVFKGASSMYDTLYKNLQSMMLDEMTPEEVLKETTEYYDTNLK